MTDTNPQRGRRPDASSKSGKIREFLKSGMSAAEIAKKVGSTVGLVYNVKARMGGTDKRGPGPLARTQATSLDGFASILDAVKGAERERTQLRGALERIQSVIADVLA